MIIRKIAVATAIALCFQPGAYAGQAEAEKWVDDEFQPSTLDRQQQMTEMEWFIEAAAPFQGMEINVLSETIPTHEYESKVLTKAFEEITGIKVNHQLLGEGEVVQAASEFRSLDPYRATAKSAAGASGLPLVPHQDGRPQPAANRQLHLKLRPCSGAGKHLGSCLRKQHSVFRFRAGD